MARSQGASTLGVRAECEQTFFPNARGACTPGEPHIVSTQPTCSSPRLESKAMNGSVRCMKVLLIGNGGREHALAWKLAQSPRVTALYALPGNPGTAQFAENVPLDVMAFDKIEKFIRQNAIEFVVIGPEDPLAAGLADRILAMGVKVFGPTREAARIEGDKWFAKEIMRHQSIPTAEARAHRSGRR